MWIEFTTKEKKVFVKEFRNNCFGIFTSKADARLFNYIVLGSRYEINLWLCKN